MIERETSDEIDLTNGVTIGVHTSSYKSVRGRTLAAALCDEVAFWRSDDSRNPAEAILRALRPSLSTIPHAPLICASSTYMQDGALYDAFIKHHGKDPSNVMVWKADTQTMNPSFRQSVIDEAYATDAAASKAVSVAGVFPDSSHDPITYPFAVIKAGDTPDARAFLAFLATPGVRVVWTRYGFKVE